MNLKLTVLGLALLIGVSGNAIAADQASFDAAYAAGQTARKGAAAVKFEWRDTRKILKSAEKLAAAGDFAKAVSLAKKAEAQGLAGQAQAKEQANRWQDFVVK